MTDSSKGQDSNVVTITKGNVGTVPAEVIKAAAPASTYAKRALVTVERKSDKTETFEVELRADGSVTIDFPAELVSGDQIKVETL